MLGERCAWQCACNAERYWYTLDRGWINAIDLRFGDRVPQLDGEIEAVRWIEVVQRSQAMYNLTVAVAHTFFVGDQQWLVHNADCGETIELYRAVGVREFDQIMKDGSFAPGGNSLEGRQFAFTLDEALNYARTDPSKVAVIKVTIPKEALAQFHYTKSTDPHLFPNGVITVNPGFQFNLFEKIVQSIEHIF